MKVFPVVHINTPETAVAEGQTAFDLGADGVYLIDHSGSQESVFETLDKLRAERPESYVGINLLGHTALDVVQLLERRARTGVGEIPSAVWVDDIRDRRGASELPKLFKDSEPALRSIRLLGGVAFKYTSTFTEDPERAASETRALRDSVDVVTTSGSGTGTAPSVEKIRAVKTAAGATPVAVASGISIENLHDYAGAVDEILVASSVETHPYSGIFDRDKLGAFIEAAHNLD